MTSKKYDFEAGYYMGILQNSQFWRRGVKNMG